VSTSTFWRPAWRVNIAEVLLDDQLARHGDEPALRFPGGEWTFDEVARRVGELTGDLRDWGVGQGDRVALALPDGPSWVVAFVAVVRLGAVAALVPGSLSHERRAEAVARAQPTLLITNEPGLAPRIPAVCPEGSTPGHGPDPGPAATRGDDPAYLLLTSGTTGPPKWAVHRHRDISVCLATYGRHILRLRPGDTTYSSASLSSSYGLGNSLYFPMGSGACAWIDGERPNPSQAAAACIEGGVTVMCGVPTFWARLARHVAEGRQLREAFAGVRLAISAGEPLSTVVFDAVQDQLGFDLVDGLGSSEATNLYLSNRPGHAIRGSVGRVVPGYQVQVCDADGQRVKAGDVGQLLVRGGSVMAGYLGDDIATAHTLADGWLHTGDLVQQRPDGAYRFVGRAGDAFKSGGLWVDPHRVVAVLDDHAGVAEVTVIGAPDPLGVVRVVAVVAPSGEAPDDFAQDLVAYAGARLARHEVPWTVAIVSELPTTGSGKIRREEVARLAAQALARGPYVAT
jgi:acyl-coenzyme A synthetase/AMP-(fatty) acid ligase